MSDLPPGFVLDQPTAGNGLPQGFVLDGASAGGVQDFEPRQFTTGEKVKRKVGLAAQGLNDSLYGLALAPADISGWIARKTGLVSADATPPSRAATNALASVPGAVGLASPDAPTRIEPAGSGERAAYGVGEGVGNALGVMTGAGALANTARGVTQGVANVLRTQPVTQTLAGAAGGGVAEGTKDPLLGIAASLATPVAGSVVRRAVTPITNQLSPQATRLSQAADAEGIRQTAGQRTGSPGLLALESTMAKTPGAAGPMQRTLDEQRGDFNAATLRRAGVTSREASPEVIDRAFVNAGQTFDDLASRTVLNADTQFARDVAQVETNYGRRLPTDVRPVFTSYMDDLAPMLQAARTPGANPQIAGEVYQTIRSDIAKRARDSQSNPPLQDALNGLVEALDNAMERSTSGALRGEWQAARREYQALMTVDKAMQGGRQADRVDANVPFGALRQAVVQADQRGFSRGRGQLNEVSRIGDFIADKVPNSGTPTRLATMNPLMYPMLGYNALLSRLYNTGPVQNYLSNQVMGRTNYPAQISGTAAREGVAETTDQPNALRRRGGSR